MKRDTEIGLAIYGAWFVGLILLSGSALPRGWFDVYLMLPFVGPLTAIAFLTVAVRVARWLT